MIRMATVQLGVVKRRSLAALRQRNPDLVRNLRANAVKLQRRQQAQHRLGHTLAYLQGGLVFGDFGIRQAIQATGHPVQLACLVHFEKKLG